jgi:cyclin A
LVSCTGLVSPGRSGDFVSIDETMSTCDSMKSPDFEYIDNQDSSMLASLQRRTNEHLRILEDRDVEGLMKFILRLALLSVFCCTFC